ncbi:MULTISPECIES: CRISPR-associated helicase Cas3' [unclassified Saccharopolyspora]|uniref:CRISPR-associated helicase Cas3' n=1 Tax=unclassified Saccharopolyspora TaxID=2646250 RepID=UPI001CD4E494|nr:MULTISPECIES: CRISPR-associated helicase Cas3' [unclassified Saccharopolyspora]MCA1186708.1 CRISPR-associated helicase Cas3' [Saccharopolyspora sp. 6T]MCA1194604.1 CRISPR-associated helicase Cas3' [Saccharopolyspora sp. 6V]MCA1278351.1 CRISPR-associated helicase Cas3' [Saccharopolyspora sp. 7B]
MAARPEGDDSALVVFISYLHESDEHKSAVRQLADLLIDEGFDVRIDAYTLIDRVNLQNWMQQEIEKADYTLVIVSPNYEKVALGEVNWNQSRGLRAEVEIMQSKLNFDRTTWTPRFLPVLIPGHTVDEIPEFLGRSVCTHYEIDGFTADEAGDLLDVLYKFPSSIPPKRGNLQENRQRHLERKKSRARGGHQASTIPPAKSATKPAEPPHPLIAAHSPNERGDWHSLGDHSRSTATLARGFAEHWGAGPLAEAFGLFHDAGKASSTWQRRLREVQGSRSSVGRHDELGTRMVKDVAHLGAMAVLGHHSGLSGVSELKRVLRASAPEGEAEAKARFLAEVPEAQEILDGGSLIPQTWIEDPLLYEMGLRMTFSALVDADRLDTIAHKNGTRPTGESAADMDVLVKRFEDRRAEMLKELPPRPMDAVRQDVYDSVLAKATLPPGIYRLPAPTGAGKTLAQGGFALHHAKKWGKRRIVVTMPLITVTEQNAQIYRRLLDQTGAPVVLEHHSQVHIDESNERERAEWVKAASENWDAAFVVTTTVQLFESMFGRHPSQVRKLHRLANSVLVLDEVQSLPPRLLLPILDSLRLLVQHFGTTVLLTSATQPEFQSLSVWREIQLEPTSLIDDVADLFERARRVEYEWRLDPRPTFIEVAEELVEQEQALVMVNSTKDSRRLYRLLKEQRDDVWHLSSRMYPRHRSRVLEEVNRRLQEAQPVILVATQLVEAGVDISFPLLWRAIAPADSLQQSAGRAGRHGESTARVVIFDPSDGHAPPEYKTRIAVTRSHFGPGKADPDDPTALREYYLELYRKLGLEGSNMRNARHLNAGRTIQESRKRLEYRDVVDGPSRDAGFEGGRRDRDKAFRMISQNSVPVVIHDGSPEQQAHLTALTEDKADAAAAVRALQGWMVQLPIWTVDKLRDGHLEHVVGDLNIWRGPYDEGVGIDEEPLVAESTG